MRRNIIIVIIIVLLSSWAIYEFVASSSDGADGQESNSNKITSTMPKDNEEVEEKDEVGLEEGYLAPDLELKTWDGKTVKLSDYRGEKVVVNFWATWCPPCREEIPDLRKFYKEKDVEILAVNLTDTESSKIDVGNFIDNYKMSFPILLDEKSAVATTYSVMAYPTSYMIDEDGRIQFVAIGAMNYDIMVQQYEKMDQ